MRATVREVKRVPSNIPLESVVFIIVFRIVMGDHTEEYPYESTANQLEKRSQICLKNRPIKPAPMIPLHLEDCSL